MASQSRFGIILRHAVLLFFVWIVLFPLIWIVLSSVKTVQDIYSGDIWPNAWDFSHYQYVLTRIETLPQNIANSILVTLVTVLITTFCAILGGYALVHLRLPGQIAVVSVLIGTLFFPARLLSLISIYQIQRDLGLINVPAGLILPYTTMNLALSILIMRGVFSQIPHELIEASRIDGCNRVQTLYRILAPLLVNGIVVVGIVNFVTVWGEYVIASTLLDDQSKRTLPVMLSQAFSGTGAFNPPRLAATYVISIAPGIIMFTLLQRLYFRGLTEGAIKL